AAVPPAPAKAGGPPPMPKLSALVEAMERLEQLLGVPEEGRKGTRGSGEAARPPGQVELALATTATAMRAEYDQKLAELGVRLVEDPRSRLAGAEEALRQFREHGEQTLRNPQELARELAP